VDLRLPSAWPEFGVLELQPGQVFGSHGWVFTDDGAVVPELSWYGEPSERIRVPRRLPAAIELGGSCLSLVSDWSYRNFAHFLLDGLGRLAVFLDAGFSLADVDHVYCPSPPTGTAARLFERFGIPRAKRVWATSQTVFRAERLFVPSLPAAALAYPPWLARFLRRVAGVEHAGPSNRRLYVSRRGYGRHAVSERDVEALLAAHGFEVYDASDARSQPEDFDQAEMVVGPHGAGLANIAFCRPGTRVVEIVPTDNAYPFYFSLAVAAGLDYGYIAARSVEERGRDAFGPSPFDFELPLHELAATLPAPRESLA
jgi:capsular polysaccharide biosynthesis protein